MRYARDVTACTCNVVIVVLTVVAVVVVFVVDIFVAVVILVDGCGRAGGGSTDGSRG